MQINLRLNSVVDWIQSRTESFIRNLWFHTCAVINQYFLLFQGVYGLLDHKLANLFIQSSNANLFQNRTVKELLWGYRDPMLNSMIGVFYPVRMTTFHLLINHLYSPIDWSIHKYTQNNSSLHKFYYECAKSFANLDVT